MVEIIVKGILAVMGAVGIALLLKMWTEDSSEDGEE